MKMQIINMKDNNITYDKAMFHLCQPADVGRIRYFGIARGMVQSTPRQPLDTHKDRSIYLYIRGQPTKSLKQDAF